MSGDPGERGGGDASDASDANDANDASDATDEIDRWEWELELPSSAAVGTLAVALLPHLPLLHVTLVLAQLSLRSSRDEEH